MDERPGGGGVGTGDARQPLPPQQQGSSISANPPIGGGGGIMVPHQQDELSRPQQQYTIPGILHYIQHEWARFEMERAHWEVERAELQVSPVSLALKTSRASASWGPQQPGDASTSGALQLRRVVRRKAPLPLLRVIPPPGLSGRQPPRYPDMSLSLTANVCNLAG